jgi:DNA polymerase-3 subunit delta'
MKRFDEIFGQEQAIGVLRQMWAEERLPHGLIFAGPVGVGKATTADAMAALFLCEKPTKAGACGKCPSCHLLVAGTHPDYHVLVKEMIRAYKPDSKATGMGIDVVREELVRRAGSKTAMGQGKVFVIEQAELMTPDAQNASLKTLEEPSGRTLIVLLTDAELSLLPTIRSRCQVVRFAKLGDEIVSRELQKRQIGKQDATDAAGFADGSLGLALRWLAEGVVARGREVRQRIEGLLGGGGAADLAEWLRAATDEYAAKQLERDEQMSKLQASRDGTVIYLHFAGQILRRRLAETEDAAELERLCTGIDALAQAERYLDANVTVSLIFQQLAVKLEGLFAR